jgi:hypothetical protein
MDPSRRAIADDELAHCEQSPTNQPTKGELSPTTSWPTIGEQLFIFSIILNY